MVASARSPQAPPPASSASSASNFPSASPPSSSSSAASASVSASSRLPPHGLSALTPTPRLGHSRNSSMTSHHRQSFSQDLRGPPQSPRQRHPSTTSAVVQDLMNNPPLAHRQKGEGPFADRDWKTVRVDEVIDPAQLHWAELDATVEHATSILVDSGSPNVVLVRRDERAQDAYTTFDYSDLNSYLLLVVGLVQPSHSDPATAERLNSVAEKARLGRNVQLSEIQNIGPKESLVTLPQSASLAQAVEIFGSGIHRIIITKDTGTDAVGVLTQLRLVAFFWENARNFGPLDHLFPATLKEAGVSARPVVSINGDRPLFEALQLMHRESVTSLPVLDNHNNVVGNISHVDTRLLTTSSAIPLFKSSCIHFISVILSERGREDGKDSFPVFYVNPFSTFAHTVAKLVATRSHRMWIVDAPSPASSAPPTPTVRTTAPAGTFETPTVSAGQSVPAASLPGQHMSGRLSGVISLTNVLNLIATASGLSPHDPDEARRQRRGSSSSSVRASIDSARSSHTDLGRSGSLRR